MAGSISVLASKELRTVIRALKTFDKEHRKWIRKVTRDSAKESWIEATRAYTESRIQVRVLSDTARVAVSDQNVTLSAGTVGRALSKNGAKPKDVIRAAEFGSDPNRMVKTTSSKGKSYSRRMGNAFGPRNPKGNAIYPAAASVIPKFASLWIRTVIRSLHEAFEEGQ